MSTFLIGYILGVGTMLALYIYRQSRKDTGTGKPAGGSSPGKNEPPVQPN